MWSNSLSAVRSEAPIWIADAAIHRSLAWAYGQWVTDHPAGQPQFCHSGQQCVGDRNDSRCPESIVRSLAADSILEAKTLG